MSKLWVKIDKRSRWVAYWLINNKRYSRVALLPIDDNELCKLWNIYKVKEENGKFIEISKRPDCADNSYLYQLLNKKWTD